MEVSRDIELRKLSVLTILDDDDDDDDDDEGRVEYKQEMLNFKHLLKFTN